MLAAATKRVIASKAVSSVARRYNSSQASVESLVREKASKLAERSMKAPSVSAIAAKIAWEKEIGVFVDLREGSSGISLDGFERIPASQLAKQLSKLEEVAKNSNTKDIYFLDSSGYHSGTAVNMISEFPQFSGYNVRAIQGGLGEWMADNGPWEASNPELAAWIQKVNQEAKAETINEQYLNQVSSELGLGASDHKMLSLPEGSYEVQENTFDATQDKSFDMETFKQFIQKLKL